LTPGKKRMGMILIMTNRKGIILFNVQETQFLIRII